jgi:hypothetical protein
MFELHCVTGVAVAASTMSTVTSELAQELAASRLLPGAEEFDAASESRIK